MADRIQVRRDTAANWASVNPILSQGEPGLDLTNGVLKFGNGVDAWADLTGISGVGGGQDGADGREIELQATATHLQWRYVGDVSWVNLIPLADIVAAHNHDGTYATAGHNHDGTYDPAGSADAVPRTISLGVVVDGDVTISTLESVLGGGYPPNALFLIGAQSVVSFKSPGVPAWLGVGGTVTGGSGPGIYLWDGTNFTIVAGQLEASAARRDSILWGGTVIDHSGTTLYQAPLTIPGVFLEINFTGTPALTLAVAIPDPWAEEAHNHDGAYSPIGHDHSGVYDPAGSAASAQSAAQSYADGLAPNYATAGHNHDGTYATAGHDHTGVYSPVGHDHSGVYAPVSHTHDNNKGFVNHGSTASTARPSGYASVEWYGTVEPTNAIEGDTWNDPT